MQRRDNAAKLRALMREHGLTRKAAAEIAGVSQKAVDSWLAPPGAAMHRALRDNTLELFEIRLLKRKG